MALMVDSLDASAMAGKRSPLLQATGLDYTSQLPAHVDGATESIPGADAKEEGDDEEMDTLDDDTFSGNASPTNTNQTTPDWRQTTPSTSPTVTSKIPKTKSVYRPPIRTSSPSPAATTHASASRPLFQERGSPVSAKESKRSGAKRQLMPSIPVRKESASSLEALSGRSKSSTSIQTLAQAIAARAQHVAAANATAKAGTTDNASPSIANITDMTADEPAVTEADRSSHSGNMPRSSSTSSSILDPELFKVARTSPENKSRSFIPMPNDEEVELVRSESSYLGQTSSSAIGMNNRSSQDSTYSQDSFRWSKAGWNVVQEPVAVEKKERGESESVDIPLGKVRTSDSDHSVSTGQTSHGDHRQPVLIGTGSAALPKSEASSGSSHDVFSDAPQTKARTTETTVAGLGIVDGSEMSLPAQVTKGLNSSGLDSFGTASDGTSSITSGQIHDYNTPELPFPSSPNNLNTSLTTSSSLSRPRRKSRPGALTLNTMSSPKTPASTSLARTVASPSSKTPPPTMPPSEPLPPVPPTPSLAYNKMSSISNRLSSPRNSGLDSSSPLIAAFAAMASHRSRPRLESDPSPKKSQFEDASLQQNRSSLTTSAMVSANHATTLAGAENAQAVLNQVAVEPSFNEKRASMKLLARDDSPKRFSDPTVAMPRLRLSDVDNKQRSLEIEPTITSGPPKINEEREDVLSPSLTDGGEGEWAGGEEVEEAVVTRVTSIPGTANLMPNGMPRLIRTESAPSASGADEESGLEEGATSTASRNVVGRMRAQTRAPKVEKDAVTSNRNVTVAPPTAWNSRPVEKASIKAGKSTLSTGDSGNSQQVRTELHSPLAGGSSDAHYSGNTPTPGAWSVQSRRTEMDEDRSDLSPVDKFGRLKRTEGRFAGAFGEISLAFRQLQAEKKTLEKVVRATTPLAGVGNGEDLGQYLTSLSSKLALSTAEIRRLLDLLDQQRNIMDYMVETHQLEIDAYLEEINDLKDDLNAVETEAETHRMNCIKLTESLDQASRDVTESRSETLVVKRRIVEEESKRDQFTRLLRSAREELSRLEGERAQAVQEKTEGQGAHDVTRSALELSKSEHAAELQSQKEVHEAQLQALRVELQGSVQNKAQEVDSSSNGDSAAAIAVLQRQLDESRQREAEVERQLQEHKSANTAKGNDEVSIGSLSPLIAGSTEGEEALRDKLVQQEQDIAELRAAVALGAGGGGTKEEQLASLPAGRADQVQLLLADLADKRTREAQIRSAYKQLRDELRKLQMSQQQDRKRNQASYSYLANTGATGSSASSHGNAPPSSYFGGIDSSAPSTPEGAPREGAGPTPRALKRLSLPLASKQFSGLSLGSPMSSGGARSTTSPSAKNRLSMDAHSLFSSRKYATSDRGNEESESHSQLDEHSPNGSALAEEQVENLVSSPS